MGDMVDVRLSFAGVKALGSGYPVIVEKAAADAERTRLERLQRAYQRNQQAQRYKDRASRAAEIFATVAAPNGGATDSRNTCRCGSSASG